LSAQASSWVSRWLETLPRGASVLDVACGAGRHARFAAQRGLQVTAIDRDGAAFASLAAAGVETVQADLESAAWPLAAGRRFDAVLVVHYLHRPLFGSLIDAVADDGLLIYETFAVGQQAYGRPQREAFLLQPRELLERCGDLQVLAYEDGVVQGIGQFSRRQRIAALKPGADPRGALERHPL
jgi:SAM-dependent methyltransferase